MLRRERIAGTMLPLQSRRHGGKKEGNDICTGGVDLAKEFEVRGLSNSHLLMRHH